MLFCTGRIVGFEGNSQVCEELKEGADEESLPKEGPVPCTQREWCALTLVGPKD